MRTWTVVAANGIGRGESIVCTSAKAAEDEARRLRREVGYQKVYIVVRDTPVGQVSSLIS